MGRVRLTKRQILRKQRYLRHARRDRAFESEEIDDNDNWLEPEMLLELLERHRHFFPELYVEQLPTFD